MRYIKYFEEFDQFNSDYSKEETGGSPFSKGEDDTGIDTDISTMIDIDKTDREDFKAKLKIRNKRKKEVVRSSEDNPFI
jgi:hypothetical protein